MGTKATFAGNLLDHILNNVDIAGIGDASGLQNSATDGNLYIALHTADPSGSTNQTTNEANYGSYARVAVARNPASKKWTIAANTATNAEAVNFALPTSGSNALTHFSIGTAASGAGVLLFSAALTTPGADPGEDPDEGPQENSQEAVKKVYGLEGGLKSQKDQIQQVHQPILKKPKGN